jgi:hypothetical protein
MTISTKILVWSVAHWIQLLSSKSMKHLCSHTCLGGYLHSGMAMDTYDCHFGIMEDPYTGGVD